VRIMNPMIAPIRMITTIMAANASNFLDFFG